MSAEKVPQSEPNKRRDLITQFRDEYAEALDHAKISAEVTATEGWTKMYAANRHAELEARRKISESLRTLADQLEHSVLTEDSEKEIGEAKKASALQRESHLWFDIQTIHPVKEPVIACANIIENYKSKAKNEEDRAPLHAVGLFHLMLEAISQSPIPHWNADRGVVEIDEPEAKSA